MAKKPDKPMSIEDISRTVYRAAIAQLVEEGVAPQSALDRLDAQAKKLVKK